MTSGSHKRDIVFVPQSPEDAARLFRECTRLKGDGLDVRAGILESPYRPGRLAGLQEGASPDEMAQREHFSVYRDLPELLAELGSSDVPAGLDVFVSQRGMNRIHEVSASDLLVVADGSVGFGELLESIEGDELYFPHESALVPGETSLAELVMSGAILCTEGRFGGLRESILSVEIVTPAGEVIHSGSRSVKDVSGYEIISFVLGTGGLCGMISRVTLRLLPPPECRAVFAGSGDLRTLKTLSHSVHRNFRPSFLEIYEGRAADILLARWERMMIDRDSHLPVILSKNGPPPSLLVGELQGLESVVEGQLLSLVSGDGAGGASLALLKPYLRGERRGFPRLVSDELDRGGGVLHLSFYSGPPTVDVPGAVVYRSLYPERIHLYVPVKRTAAPAAEDSKGIRDLIDSVPGLRDFLAESVRPELRPMAEMLGERSGVCSRRSIDSKSLLEAVYGAGLEGLDEDLVRQMETRDKLSENVIRAFDPQGIMLP